MELWVWLSVMLGLGLTALALMVAFVYFCDRV